jgi:ATP-dependent DNA helicase RecG
MALRRLFPISSRIDYITVEGREWVPHPEKRYSQCYEFGEALVLAIPRVIANIMRDIPHAFSMQPNNIFRKDIPLIPDVVIREAVCNAVMHRDYRAGQTIQIIRYANRIEFLNPGYSLKPEDQLGLPGSITRNDQIAEVLHDLQIAEVKGTGIRTMREAMREANLSVPFFESDRTANKFTLTLLTHHFFDEKDIEWLKNFKEFDLTDEEARTLIVVREMGAITNADYRNINCVETLTASASLRRLRDLGLLEQKGRSNATYYVPTSKLLTGHIKPNLQSSNLPSLDSNLPSSNSNLPSLSSNLPSSAGQVVSSLFASIPVDLESKIENLRKKSDIEEVKSLIKDLCSLRPFRIQELSEILKRNPKYIKEVYLKSMIESGILEYTFPHQSSHPQQAYRTKK